MTNTTLISRIEEALNGFYDLTDMEFNYGNAEATIEHIDEKTIDVYVSIEAPDHWVIGDRVVFSCTDDQDISVTDIHIRMLRVMMHRMRDIDVDDYFTELWSEEFAKHNGFTPLQFLHMLMRDEDFFKQLADEFRDEIEILKGNQAERS